MIELYHVGKHYAAQERPALDDVSLKIEKGEFCLLSGPSGAGKSTLLRMLFLAEKPTQGQLMVQGKNIARISRRDISLLRRKIGVVFQDFKLIETDTVQQNVALALEIQGRSPKEVKDRSYAMIQRVGLAHKADERCDRLSGGEQQRVAIARALVVDPLILLADEPTGNLDPERSLEIMKLLQQANIRGTTVVAATHDPRLLEHFGRRSIQLEAGRVVQGVVERGAKP